MTNTTSDEEYDTFDTGAPADADAATPPPRTLLMLDEASTITSRDRDIATGRIGSHQSNVPTMRLDPKGEMPVVNAMIGMTHGSSSKSFEAIVQSMSQLLSVLDPLDELCSYCSEELPAREPATIEYAYADDSISTRETEVDDDAFSSLCEDCHDYFDQLAHDLAAVA